MPANNSVKIYRVWLALLLLSLHAIGVLAGIKDEKRLMADMFDPIDVRVRPADNFSHPVDVTMELNPLHFKQLNEPLQIFEVYAWIAVAWKDPQISWEPSDYGGITFITIKADKLWVPDIGIINSAYHLYDDIFEHDKYRAVVQSSGDVRIAFSGTFQTICLLDVTYFPFDEQICHIEFDSWSLPLSQARFSNDSFLRLTNLRENGIWNIKDSWMVFTDDYFRGVWYRTLSYSFRLRRKPKFVILNVYIPCVVLCFLELLVFCIPPEAGEKISFAITILLSLTVFQVVIDESMPATSDYFPLLSLYLLAVMMLSAMTLMFTVLVISIHHRPASRPLSRFTKEVALKKLARWISYWDNSAVKEDAETTENDWIRLAGVLDRLFFIIYLIIVVALTSGILLSCIFGTSRPEKPLTGYGYYTQEYRDNSSINDSH